MRGHQIADGSNRLDEKDVLKVREQQACFLRLLVPPSSVRHTPLRHNLFHPRP